MSSIIQTVSYKKENAKQITEKFGELLGIHKIEITLEGGETVEGVISEVGKDFITIIESNYDTIIPTSKILYCRYNR